MKPEEQRIAIAEACGWKPTLAGHGGPGWIMPGNQLGIKVSFDNLPDYLADLNAMHEAEKILSDPQIDEYKHRLMGAITDKERISQCATAAQRAEAFRRTLNLWAD